MGILSHSSRSISARPSKLSGPGDLLVFSEEHRKDILWVLVPENSLAFPFRGILAQVLAVRAGFWSADISKRRSSRGVVIISLAE